MELFDSRVALVAAGAALVGSEHVRRVLGKGLGYAAAGATMVGAPVVNAGREIVEEARGVASHSGTTHTKTSRGGSSGRS
jgi:hypothetical protein